MNSNTALLLRMPNEREMRMDLLIARVHQLKSLYTMPDATAAEQKNARDELMNTKLDDIYDILEKIEDDIDG